MKILLAVDESPYSSEAVREVIARPWPPGTIVRVLSAVEDILTPATDLWYDASGNLQHANQELTERAEQMTARIAESLADTGLKSEPLVRHGDPRTLIVDEAKEWGADLIVIGTHGYKGFKRILLGSVAHSIVSNAPCSVEVVRMKPVEDAKAEMESIPVSEARGADAVKGAQPKHMGVLRLERLISSFRIAMLATVTRGGHMHSFPIVACRAGSDKELWFFIHAHTYRVDNAESDQQVNINYADVDGDIYVSISGKARLVQDRLNLEQLWDVVYEDWFSQGIDDPDLALLRVCVDEVEYWDASESLMVRLMPEPQTRREWGVGKK
jgi:general stress protein 26/nucleotide-binding universal stress UspA family protein